MGRGKTAKIEIKLISGELVPHKACSVCTELVPMEMYKKLKQGVGGRASRCKECDKVYRAENADRIKSRMKDYYSKNRERLVAQKREYNDRPDVRERQVAWREENREILRAKDVVYKRENADKIRAYTERTKLLRSKRGAEYRKANPHVNKAKDLRRRAMKKGLPNTLSKDEVLLIQERFGGVCALTGSSENIHLDHFITLSTGCVGTVYENMVPLRGDLNSSKQDKNPFEWFALNKERYGLSEEKFIEIVEYLAQLNGMTADEFEAHVYNCYELKEAR